MVWKTQLSENQKIEMNTHISHQRRLGLHPLFVVLSRCETAGKEGDDQQRLLTNFTE